MKDTKESAGAFRVRSFAGWRVLVTGGSSGIGLELARVLVSEGAHVCIAARDAQRLADAIRDLSGSVLSGTPTPCLVTMDVTSSDSIARAIPAAVAALGGLDMVINNAGYARLGYIDELDDDAYVEMMAVNYFGPLRIARACLPYFVTQRAGRIVNVTSMLGFMGVFGYSAYCASKFALTGFTEALRQDVLPFGVRVHLCFPPTTSTPGLERENLEKPAETLAIEGKSGAFSADEVARAILRGVRQNRFHIVIGLGSWLIWMAQRIVPWLVRFVTDRELMRQLRPRDAGPLLRAAAESPHAAAASRPKQLG